MFIVKFREKVPAHIVESSLRQLSSMLSKDIKVVGRTTRIRSPFTGKVVCIAFDDDEALK